MSGGKIILNNKNTTNTIIANVIKEETASGTRRVPIFIFSICWVIGAPIKNRIEEITRYITILKNNTHASNSKTIPEMRQMFNLIFMFFVKTIFRAGGLVILKVAFFVETCISKLLIISFVKALFPSNISTFNLLNAYYFNKNPYFYRIKCGF